MWTRSSERFRTSSFGDARDPGLSASFSGRRRPSGECLAKESCNLVGVDPVVFAFAAMDSFHVEGVAEDEGDLLLGAEISKPVPDEHALGRDNDVLPVGCYGPKEASGVALRFLWRTVLPSSYKNATYMDRHEGRFHRSTCAVWCRISWASSLG